MLEREDVSRERRFTQDRPRGAWCAPTRATCVRRAVAARTLGAHQCLKRLSQRVGAWAARALSPCAAIDRVRARHATGTDACERWHAWGWRGGRSPKRRRGDGSRDPARSRVERAAADGAVERVPELRPDSPGPLNDIASADRYSERMPAI